MLLRYIRSLLPLFLLFPPAGAPSETTGKLHSNNTNTVKTAVTIVHTSKPGLVIGQSTHPRVFGGFTRRATKTVRAPDGGEGRVARGCLFGPSDATLQSWLESVRVLCRPWVQDCVASRSGGGWGGVFIVCRWRHKHWSVLMLLCFSSATCL